MAINGAWRAQQYAPQRPASQLVWGTGINPVHSRYGNGDRNVLPNVPPGDSHVPDNLIGDDVTDCAAYGYTSEDSGDFWGYGVEDGTADRPDWGEPNRGARARTTPGYPSPGQHPAGIPGGSQIRAQEHGARASWRSKLRTRRPIVQGTFDKDKGDINDARTAADSQLFVNTSMVQRDQTRAGSPRSGTASEQNAPIRSRIVGMRIPQQIGGERHEDMRPRQQTLGLRRLFYTRQAGTGDPEWMRANAAYESVPLTRQVPANPDAGSTSPGPDLAMNYGGYTSEDPVW